MAVMALPAKDRKRLRTTNLQERLNEEIRRRERVIRIFPNDESALRLIGALLAEQNETRRERGSLDMQESHDWAAAWHRCSRGQQRCCPLGLQSNRHQPARSRFTANFGLDSLRNLSCPIQYVGSYDNTNCLTCHEGTDKWSRVSSHLALISEFAIDRVICTTCRGPPDPLPRERMAVAVMEQPD